MEDPTRYLPSEQGPLALLVLFLSSVVEYLFPPFPGDTVTLFGAFLVAARGWSFAAVLASVTLGSVVGALADWWIGRLVERGRGGRLQHWRLVRLAAGRLDWLRDRFARHGLWFIAVNRFLPGVRAFFFVAAGMANLPLKWVLFWATVSALLWNVVVMLLGIVLGLSWPRLMALFRTYSLVVWLLLLVLLVGAVLLVLRRRRRRRP